MSYLVDTNVLLRLVQQTSPLEGVWKLGKGQLDMEDCGYDEQKTIPNRPFR